MEYVPELSFLSYQQNMAPVSIAILNSYYINYNIYQHPFEGEIVKRGQDCINFADFLKKALQDHKNKINSSIGQ